MTRENSTMDSFRNSAPDLRSNDVHLADFLAGGKRHTSRRKSNTMPRCMYREGCKRATISKLASNPPVQKFSDYCETRTLAICIEI